MSLDSLIAAVPDFVAFVRRDGRIVKHLGGRGLSEVAPSGELRGRRLDEIWPEVDAELLSQWVKKALTTRARVDGRLEIGGRSFEVSIGAEGRDKALCVIRAATTEATAQDSRDTAVPERPAAAVDRRGFIKRLQQSVADASLRERPLSVGLIFLDGLTDIGQGIDYAISDKVATAVLQRLPLPAGDETGGPGWYVGQLGEALLAVVIEGSTGRDAVRAIARRLGESLAQPVYVGDACFNLRPSVGIALLGQDATRPQALLECARAAMTEARRAGVADVQFYSDTLKLKPTVRLDIERELREAINEDELQLRYVGRHDLGTGRLEAICAYLRWQTQLRGDVPPSQFLPIAENTGLSLQLSQWALSRLRRDWANLRKLAGPMVRISFGALRHHLTADALARDLEALASKGAIQPDALELRINERTLATLPNPEATLGCLTGLGAKVVIDEFGRGSNSLARLSRLPIDALQVDRSFVETFHQDPAAAAVCRSVAGIARGFGFRTYAPGIDDSGRLDELLKAGFDQGLGDHYGSLPALALSPRRMRLTG